MPISATAQFERRKLDKSMENTGHLMVSIAGESKDFVRTPVSTILVLDVSGSMNGNCGGAFAQPQPWAPHQPWGPIIYGGAHCSSLGGGAAWTGTVYNSKRKIDALKETARKLVEHLSSSDEVGLVTFSDVAEVVYERKAVENKDSIYAAINSMQPTSSTNMSGGLLQAFKMINKTFKGVKRIMLLTDGLANVGVSDPVGILQLIDQREGSTISTFGFGTDCNRKLLEDIAKAAGGNSYFIDSAEDLSNTFAKELGGILSCMAQNIEVKITPNKGVKVDSVLNNFTVEDKNGVAVIKAEDVYVGENKKILIKLQLEKVPNAKPRATSLAHVEVSFDDLVSKKHDTITLNPKVEYVKAADADKEAILEIREQLAIIEAAKAQAQAVQLASVGRYDDARGLIQCSMTALNDVGTKLCSDVAALSNDVFDNMREEKYTASYGATVCNDSFSTMKGKAGTKGISSVYATQGQKDMMRSFADPSDGTAINPPASISSVAPTEVNPPTPAVPEVKTFAKKRRK